MWRAPLREQTVRLCVTTSDMPRTCSQPRPLSAKFPSFLPPTPESPPSRRSLKGCWDLHVQRCVYETYERTTLAHISGLLGVPWTTVLALNGFNEDVLGQTPLSEIREGALIKTGRLVQMSRGPNTVEYVALRFGVDVKKMVEWNEVGADGTNGPLCVVPNGCSEDVQRMLP